VAGGSRARRRGLICFVTVVVVPHDVDRVLIPGELMLLAVVLATVIGGGIVGAVVLAGSSVALLYYFVPGPDSFTGGDPPYYLAVVMYLAVGAVLVAAVSSLIAARDQLRRERGRLQSSIDLSTHFDLQLEPEATLREVARTHAEELERGAPTRARCLVAL
jgi:K+-sensing histidine kinase KdpD